MNGDNVSKKKPAWIGLKLDHPECGPRDKCTMEEFLYGKDAPYDLHLRAPFVHPEDEAEGMRWDDDKIFCRVRPRVEVGDVLWVKETFCKMRAGHVAMPGGGDEWKEDRPMYATDYVGFEKPDRDWNWSSARYMPKDFSRLTLEVTGVKIARVQDISEDDVTAEGVSWGTPDLLLRRDGVRVESTTRLNRRIQVAAQKQFAELWNSINGPDAWDANPWVIVTSFDVHQINVNEYLETGKDGDRHEQPA